MKSGTKSFTKRSGSSAPRRSFASRSGSSWGGNSWGSGSRSSGGRSRSWLSIGGSREPSHEAASQDFRWDGTDGTAAEGGASLDLAQVLGEGLAQGLGEQIGGNAGGGSDSAAFWRGMAVCAILVAVIVLLIAAGS